jgi:hypothetical protein
MTIEPTAREYLHVTVALASLDSFPVRATDSVHSGSDQEHGARINAAARRDTFRSAKEVLMSGLPLKFPALFAAAPKRLTARVGALQN